MPRPLLLFIMLWLLPISVSAHNLPYSAVNTELQSSGSGLDLHTELKQDVSQFYYFAPGDQRGRQGFYQQYFAKNFLVRQLGSACSFSLQSLTIKNNVTYFDGRFECPKKISNISELSIHASIFTDEFVRIDHFVSLDIGGQKWKLVFNKKLTDFPSQVGAQEHFPFLSFVKLGIEHILTGYDHLLFLLSLILLVNSLRKVFALVTAFTLAHSLTLLLAGLRIITLSSRIVEPLIALSIAYVAYKNIERLKDGKKERLNTKAQERWLATFGFGLIHGLGFAGALQATAIPAGFFLPAVLLFNIGIELGQFSVILLLWPVLKLIKKSAYSRRVLLFISGVIFLIAIFLIIKRI